jgi:hypothetical protein
MTEGHPEATHGFCYCGLAASSSAPWPRTPARAPPDAQRRQLDVGLVSPVWAGFATRSGHTTSSHRWAHRALGRGLLSRAGEVLDSSRA